MNAAGPGPATSDLVLNVGCAAPPVAPTTLTAAVSGTFVAVNWNVEPGTTSTVLEVGFVPGATNLTFPFAAPTAAVGTNAPPNTYYIRVRAVNACGQSPPSVERTVTVP